MRNGNARYLDSFRPAEIGPVPGNLREVGVGIGAELHRPSHKTVSPYKAYREVRRRLWVPRLARHTKVERLVASDVPPRLIGARPIGLEIRVGARNGWVGRPTANSGR